MGEEHSKGGLLVGKVLLFSLVQIQGCASC